MGRDFKNNPSVLEAKFLVLRKAPLSKGQPVLCKFQCALSRLEVDKRLWFSRALRASCLGNNSY